jgi:uncharacterized membrane protein
VYSLEPIFWIKLIFLVVIILISLFIFTTLMRKWLKVKKTMFSFTNHMNEKHKKIDLTIRLIFIPLIIAGSFFNLEREFTERIWFLETGFILICLVLLTEAVQAFMEWKYSENKNDYIYTLCQLVFIGILGLSIITTDFFGMF